MAGKVRWWVGARAAPDAGEVEAGDLGAEPEILERNVNALDAADEAGGIWRCRVKGEK